MLSKCFQPAYLSSVFMANFLPVRATGDRRCSSGVVASNPLHGACFPLSSSLPGMP